MFYRNIHFSRYRKTINYKKKVYGTCNTFNSIFGSESFHSKYSFEAFGKILIISKNFSAEIRLIFILSGCKFPNEYQIAIFSTGKKIMKKYLKTTGLYVI